MKLITWFAIGLVSLLLGLFGGSAITMAADEKGFQALTLTVVMAKPQFLALEPLTLTLVLKNTTSVPITAHNGLCLNCERFDVYRGRVGQPRTKIPELSGVRALQSLSARTLYPGEVLKERILFEMDLQENFSEPGPYRLHVVVWDQKKQISIESKPVTVVIREPQGLDRLALQHLEDLYAGKAETYWMRGTTEQDEEYMLLFPDTAYAPYVADSLAEYYASRNPMKSIKYGEFTANRTDYPWADKALSNLFDVYQRMGDTSKTEGIGERLKANHPRSEYTKPFQDDGEPSPAVEQFLREQATREGGLAE